MSNPSERDVAVHHSYVSLEVFARKLLGRTDIEDALKKLDSLIQEEFQMATAQILKVTTEIATEVKDGEMSCPLVASTTLNGRTVRCRQSQHRYAADFEPRGGRKVRCGRSKVFVISQPYHFSCRD